MTPGAPALLGGRFLPDRLLAFSGDRPCGAPSDVLHRPLDPKRTSRGCRRPGARQAAKGAFVSLAYSSLGTTPSRIGGASEPRSEPSRRLFPWRSRTRSRGPPCGRGGTVETARPPPHCDDGLKRTAQSPEPGSAILRCCSASTVWGVTAAMAAWTLLPRPATTSPSPRLSAS